jgi:hypothetical protein
MIQKEERTKRIQSLDRYDKEYTETEEGHEDTAVGQV